MKLQLSRTQEQKRKSIEFVLTATAILTQEEAELIQRYQLVNEVVAVGTMTVGLISKSQVPFQVRAGHLLQGYTQRFEDLGSMIEFEDRMKRSCELLLQYLDAARSFGGQETIEIHLPEDSDAAKRPALS